MASFAGLESVVLKVLTESITFLAFLGNECLMAVLEKGNFFSCLRPRIVEADGFLAMLALVGVWYLVNGSKSKFYFWNIFGSCLSLSV